MKLGKYKGLEVKKADLSVTQQEIEQMIRNMQRKHAVVYHIDERPAQVGDVVILNYEGFIDGASFLGGRATHHRLVLGEDKWIADLEAQIIGKTMGTSFEAVVSFPITHANQEIAGKEAVFQIDLLVVGREEIPDFDDAFAKDFSSFSSAEELRDSFCTNLIAKKEAAEEKRIQEELLSMVIADAEIPLPKDVLEELAEEIFAEKEEDLIEQGLSGEEFLKRSHQTLDGWMESCSEQARRRYQETAVLHAIAQAEGLTVSEEEMEEVICEMAFYEGMDAFEFAAQLDEDTLTGIELQILCDGAMEIVRTHAQYK